jgi:DNA-binding response OmpR family regulator
MSNTPLVSPVGANSAHRRNALVTRILVVEDSLTRAEELRLILEEAGFDHYLVKPAAPKDLHQLLMSGARC